MSQLAVQAVRFNIDRQAPVRPYSIWHVPATVRRAQSRTLGGAAGRKALQRSVTALALRLRNLRKVLRAAYPVTRSVVAGGLEVMAFGATMAAAMGSLWLLGG